MTDKLASVTLATGQSMPTIGFGVYGLDPKSCAEAVENALKMGYRHVDTAEYYVNEAEVGQGVRNSRIPREQVFITSKVYGTTIGYEATLKGVEESARKLGFDYYDLYLIHSLHGGPAERVAKYKALLEVKARSLVRAVGVSNFSERHITDILEAGLEMPAVNQIELHPWCQQHPIVSYCESKGIVMQAYSPLHGKSPAQVPIRWSLQRGLVPLPKATSPGRIAENIDVFDFVLDDRDMAAMATLDQGPRGAVTWNPVGIA